MIKRKNDINKENGKDGNKRHQRSKNDNSYRKVNK